MFVLAYRDRYGANRVSAASHRRYFLQRVTIENYNIEIDGKNLYDQPINDLIKQYDKIRKISTGQSDDYATGCLLEFAYFGNNYRLIAHDLSKQKALDADSRTIQQKSNWREYKSNNLLHSWKIKETILEFAKGTTSFVTTYKWLNILK